MSDKNIDKDIDILKNIISDDVVQFYCTENAQKLCDNYCEKNNEDCFYLQAIENVLLELEKKDKKLEEYRKFHNRRLKEWKKKFEKQEKIFLSELDERDKDLETWKKIAEKLVDSIVSDGKILALTCKRIINKTEDECLEQNCLCDECIIDWARKEVENNDR